MENKNKEKSIGKKSESKLHEVKQYSLTVINLGKSQNQIILNKVIESEFVRCFQ